MLNKKKVALVVISFIAFISIIIGIIYFINTSKNIEYTTLTASDGKFSIQIPDTIKYKANSLPNNDFTIDLYSEQDEMFMYATVIEKSRELDLYEVASDDKASYFKDKENIRNDSGIVETKIGSYKGIEYNLEYFDKQYNKDFYCHVVWIETSNYIYILNFEVKNENADKYREVFINIKNSFKEI